MVGAFWQDFTLILKKVSHSGLRTGTAMQVTNCISASAVMRFSYVIVFIMKWREEMLFLPLPVFIILRKVMTLNFFTYR